MCVSFYLVVCFCFEEEDTCVPYEEEDTCVSASTSLLASVLHTQYGRTYPILNPREGVV
jgi:hypothetical protein